MGNLQYRLLEPAEVPEFTNLCAAMAAFHGAAEPLPREQWAQKLAADGPGGSQYFEAVCAFDDRKMVGFLVFSSVYETVFPGNGAFVRDVFVLETYRRQGVGRNLMANFAQLCLDRGWRRVDWHADRLDFDARTFYDMLCTDSFKLDRLSYRIEGDEIETLAGKGDDDHNQS
ncbi:GNAT family N-acetyltransferase [Hwanghaeella grinnelliae]|uniref:GNAT family N-acetyltransferase n=1 Tax=Hwanghaeella grinnelliae TaxID=2500179 RepID=A0A3S2W1U6_9PROT|nr:GNAT family N-acetyltransferase [Hwanghaeella grinnelliae]RVU33661.1 GNAT family N-acetyltransferase [Hwanghaeella grinnelliae]